MYRLGIEQLSAFGMPPVEYVHLAAELGCEHISTGLTPVPWNPCGFPAWSLRDDALLRRKMIVAMRENRVSISVAEGFAVRANADVNDRVADLDLVAELGAQRVSAVSMEPDMRRALDQLSTLAELCAQRSMGFTLEFAPPHPINNLESALAAIRYIDKPNSKIVIDAMHFFRSGGEVSDLAALDPKLIGYAQLCDVPLAARHGDYMQEACFERMIPGEGELPLLEFLSVLPRDLVIGLEIPILAEIKANGNLRTLLGRAVEATRNLLGQLDR